MVDTAYPWNPAAPVPADMARLFKVDWSDHRRKKGLNPAPARIVLSGNLHHEHKPIIRRQAAI